MVECSVLVDQADGHRAVPAVGAAIVRNCLLRNCASDLRGYRNVDRHAVPAEAGNDGLIAARGEHDGTYRLMDAGEERLDGVERQLLELGEVKSLRLSSDIEHCYHLPDVGKGPGDA